MTNSVVPVQPLAVQASAVALDNKKSEVSYSGRACALIKAGKDAVKSGSEKIFDATSKLFNDVEATQQFAKVVMFGMGANEIIRGTTPNAKLNDSMESYDSFIDGVGLLRDASYFTTNRHKKEWNEGSWTDGKKVGVMGRVALLITDIAGGVYWLASLGVLSLAKAASAIGNSRVFSFLKDVTLLGFVKLSMMVSFGFFGISALQKILSGDDVTENALRLVNATAEVAIKVLGFAGQANPVCIVTLGLVAAGAGIAAFLHGQYASKDDAEEKKETVAKRPAVFETIVATEYVTAAAA